MKMSTKYSQLAEALNSGQMRERIQRQLELSQGANIELQDFHIARVFPRSDNSFTIQYRMKSLTDKSEKSRPMILCGHLLGEKLERPEYVGRNKVQVMLFDDLRLLVPIFPFDPQLPAIKELCVKGNLPAPIEKSVNAALKTSTNTEIVDYEVLGYRLERRCVIRHILGGSGKHSENPMTTSIVTKIARQSKMKETKKFLALLEQGGFVRNGNNGLTIPVTYHIDIKRGIQVSESAPGETLHNLTGDKRFPLACEEAASLLRKLHQVDASSLTKYGLKDELHILDEKIRLISSIFPELASSFVSAFDSIKSSARELDDDFEAACIHRDFYDKQILYSAKRSTLLDFDSLACGDPAQDCGNFMGHLILRQLQEPANAPKIDKGIKAFKSDYEYADDNFEVRVKWWQAATLLRLGVLYSLRPKWHQLSTKLLSRAFANLQGNKTQMEGVNENYHS